MVDYKHQESTYIPFALEGDIRRWNRYKGKMMIRRIIRDIKWSCI